MANKKRWLAGALAAMMALGTLSGCGGASQDTSGSGDSGDSGSGEKIHIQYWHINGETQGGAAVEEFISEFNASQDRIEVEGRFNASYDELLKNLQADTAAGNAPGRKQKGSTI